MTYEVEFPKKSFFYPLQKGLKLKIEIDSEMESSGAFCYSFQNAGALMKVKDISDQKTYMHEFVHACQVFSGPPTLENEMFRFDRNSLEVYVTSKGLYFDEECAILVEDFLQKMIAKGLYPQKEYLTEYPAYYVENAFGGEKVLEAIWADTQKLIKKPDSFWTRVQKQSQTEWMKKHLIHLIVPAYLILLLVVSYMAKPKDKPFFRPWVRDLINHVIQK